MKEKIKEWYPWVTLAIMGILIFWNINRLHKRIDNISELAITLSKNVMLYRQHYPLPIDTAKIDAIMDTSISSNDYKATGFSTPYPPERECGEWVEVWHETFEDIERGIVLDAKCCFKWDSADFPISVWVPKPCPDTMWRKAISRNHFLKDSITTFVRIKEK